MPEEEVIEIKEATEDDLSEEDKMADVLNEENNVNEEEKTE